MFNSKILSSIPILGFLFAYKKPPTKQPLQSMINVYWYNQERSLIRRDWIFLTDGPRPVKIFETKNLNSNDLKSSGIDSVILTDSLELITTLEKHNINRAELSSLDIDIILDNPIKKAWPSHRLPIFYEKEKEIELKVSIKNIWYLKNKRGPRDPLHYIKKIRNTIQTSESGWGLPATCIIFFTSMGITLFKLVNIE